MWPPHSEVERWQRAVDIKTSYVRDPQNHRQRFFETFLKIAEKCFY